MAETEVPGMHFDQHKNSSPSSRKIPADYVSSHWDGVGNTVCVQITTTGFNTKHSKLINCCCCRLHESVYGVKAPSQPPSPATPEQPQLEDSPTAAAASDLYIFQDQAQPDVSINVGPRDGSCTVHSKGQALPANCRKGSDRDKMPRRRPFGLFTSCFLGSTQVAPA